MVLRAGDMGGGMNLLRSGNKRRRSQVDSELIAGALLCVLAREGTFATWEEAE
jgi:hypothetical protein